MRKNKKGQVLGSLSNLAVGIAVLAVALTVTFLVIGEGESEIIDMGQACGNTSHTYNATSGRCCANADTTFCLTTNESGTSFAFNSTATLASATDTVPGWVPLIVNQQVICL